MKKTLTVLAMVAAAGFAWGDVELALPTSTTGGATWVARDTTPLIDSTNTMTYTYVVSAVADKGVGAYVMGNNKNLSNTDADGKFTNVDNVGSTAMWVRSGAQGESFALVLDGASLAGVEGLTSISVSTSAAVLSNTTNNTIYNYGVILAAVDAEGTVLSSTTGTASQTAGVSLSIDVTDWADGNKVVLGIIGVDPKDSNYPYNATITVGGIEVKGVTVPEPATATLGLLALAGLAARRRRK